MKKYIKIYIILFKNKKYGVTLPNIVLDSHACNIVFASPHPHPSLFFLPNPNKDAFFSFLLKA